MHAATTRGHDGSLRQIRPLNDAIVGNSPDLRKMIANQLAKWYRPSLSDVAIVIDGAEIVFADNVVEAEMFGRTYTVRIVIFTNNLLVTVTTESDEKGERHTTSARSRSDLTSFGVAAGTPALGDNWPSSWPESVRLTLHYGDEAPLLLPGSASADYEQFARAVVPAAVAHDGLACIDGERAR
ncbi:hypothetical protein GALL_330300 [mine drainage metagenome]|uniref:Uncharacterized protein n=1 Tax=mine drainage metagenome TaxID=410659 RepID=A0A1J5QP20_9ZZZZ